MNVKGAISETVTAEEHNMAAVHAPASAAISELIRVSRDTIGRCRFVTATSQRIAQGDR